MGIRKSTDFIVVHCAATKPSMDIGFKEIDEWHKKRGWAGCGYHFIVRRNGEVEEGRDINETGAHAKGYNSKSLGICLVGGVNKDNQPSDNFTDAQMDTLEKLLDQLTMEYSEAEVIGHRDISSKACPSFDAKTWWVKNEAYRSGIIDCVSTAYTEMKRMDDGSIEQETIKDLINKIGEDL